MLVDARGGAGGEEELLPAREMRAEGAEAFEIESLLFAVRSRCAAKKIEIEKRKL